MSILTETKYLDEITFASGLIRDDACTDISLWTTDGDTGAGVSSQTIFDGKSCFKMDVVTAGAGNLASRSLDIGTFQTNPNIVTIKLYHDTLGTLANGDYFSLVLQATTYRCSIRFASDGLFIYDGSVWNEVGTNLVQQDTWQEWTFSWTQQASGVVDVYLDGVRQAAAVDCSDTTGGTTGTTTIAQRGDTVIGLTYIDYIKAGNAMRYAGETWDIREGGQLTIRTDTRWHANSPASMLGSLGSQSIAEGKIIYDGTDVRWLAITGGSGDSPIGTSITQGAVSGYYLGFWSSLTAAPATAIGATGFIKFREVTGGTFSAGALTFGAGTGAATAAGADVPGWIEIVADSASTITVPRLGEHEIRGDYFYLDDTTGTVGQQIQIPTNAGGSGTSCPGIEIETGVGTGVFEAWPALNGATNGWSRLHMGAPFGGTDARQNYVKEAGGGLLQIGEALSASGKYVDTPPQAASYTAIAHTCTYAVVSNVCTVTYTTGHLLQTGHRVGIEFTSGGAGALDASFDITVLDAYRYSFALTTGDTSGACTARPGLSIASTAHGLGVGDSTYCNFTSGSGVDGDYDIYAVTSANAYYIKYPATSAVTAGNVTVHSRYTIIFPATSITNFMDLTAGQRVYLDFTSGSGVDGTYTIVYPTVVPVVQASTYTWAGDVVTVSFSSHGRKVGDRVYVDFTSGGGTPDGVYTIASAAANSFTFSLAGSGVAGNCSVCHASFDVIANNDGAADSGNVSIKMTIGNIPPSGCKTRIPNVILREAATASRASNRVDAALASRPEWATTSAGAIDFENVCSTWFHNFGQPYSVKHRNTMLFDNLVVSECATALDIDNTHTGMYGALDIAACALTSNFAGGTIQNCKFMRGNTPASSDHAVAMSYCVGTILSKVQAGLLQYPRAGGVAFSVSYGSNLKLNECKTINQGVSLSAVNGIEINDLDYTDAINGYGRAYSALYAVVIAAGCVDVLIDGMTFGFGGTFPNVHPPAGLVSYTAASGVIIRNIGSFDSPLSCGTFRQNYYGMASALVSGGNNYDIKAQRIYIDNNARTGLITTVNSDKLVLFESVHGARYTYSAMAIFLQLNNGLNSVMKGLRPGANSVTGGSSIYGSHFVDYFIGDDMGRYVLPMNEPTAETDAYFTMVAGTRKFNSAGGILMGAVGDQAVWEDQYFRKGHTSFQNTTPTMSGGTIGNYTVEYDIDINDGNGFTNTWTTATGANLSGETIDPEDGFRLKIRITTTTANLTPITFLRIDTATTAAAQEDNLYPLVTVPVSIVVKDAADGGLISGARVYITAAAGGSTPEGTVILNEVTGITGAVSNPAFELLGTSQPIIGRVRKGTSSPLYKTAPISGSVDASGFSTTVFMVGDE